MGIIRNIQEEIRIIRERDPAIHSVMEVFLYPSFKVMIHYRIAHRLYEKGHFFWARWVSQRGVRKTGIEIHPGARIGKGLFIDHGNGVIIGETTVIGDNVTLYQGVTLGGTGKEHGKRHPTVGDNVMISAGAKVLGSFTIGDNSKIGAGSVVLSEVPSGSTVVGVPGRVVKRNNMALPQETMNQTDLPDPVKEDIAELRQANARMEERVLELGRELRKVFIPESEEYCFLDADYSQIELRVLAHISGDETLINAFRQNQDIHRLTASQVFHVPFDEVTPLQRSNAKAVNFGIVYGIGSFSLSQDLGITRKEAEQYIAAYFAKYPKIKTYMDKTIADAAENGYASTLWHRRRPMPELQSGNFVQRSFGERVAMNMPIQGSAADIIKIAMIKVHHALQEGGYRSRLILQVHDELLIETHREEKEAVAAILKENMEQAADLLAPLLVDVHEGNSWFEAK